MRYALAVALLACSGLSAAASPVGAPLKPFTAQYAASYRGIPARGALVLAPRGRQWTLSMSLGNVAASISQATLFTESGTGLLMPLGGSDRASYVGQDRAIPMRFDWKAMQASWGGDARPSRRGPVPIRAGDVDALLLQLALARDVPAGRPLNYRVVENGKVRPMSFRRTGTETITVDGRPLPATRVVASADGRTTTAWIAAGVPVPVRMERSEDGSETVSLRLTSWK